MIQDSNSHIKSALVVEGGAMRGIFSTGVLDAFLQHGFTPFDLYIGVSAGSTNLASFLAGMEGRNYKIYTDYSLRKEFINWYRFLKGGHLMDLDWLWDITIREMRLDLSKIVNGNGRYVVGLTSAQSGEAEFMTPNISNLEDMLKASSSIPILYRNQTMVNGNMYVDGGLAEPIPVKEAYHRGASNIMVLRSRQHSYHMEAKAPSILYRYFLKDYPELYRAAINRPAKYAESIEFMRNPPTGVNIIEVNPPESFTTSRLTKSKETLDNDYHSGREAAAWAMEQWNKTTQK